MSIWSEFPVYQGLCLPGSSGTYAMSDATVHCVSPWWWRQRQFPKRWIFIPYDTADHPRIHHIQQLWQFQIL